MCKIKKQKEVKNNGLNPMVYRKGERMIRRKKMRVKIYSLDYMIYVKHMREEEEERIQMGEMEEMERLSERELRMMYASELQKTE